MNTDPNETPEQLAAFCLGGADALDAEAEQATDPEYRARTQAAAEQVRRYAAALVSGGPTVPAAQARLVAHAAHMGGSIRHAALLTAPSEIRAAADALLALGVLRLVAEDGYVRFAALAAYAAGYDRPRLAHVVQPAQSWWIEEVANAEAFDASCADRSKTWPPPIMADLVEAASRTDLVRLFPFHSHNVLRFATSSLWYIGEGEVAPAFIALEPKPDRYGVFSGDLFGINELVLESDDPVAAAARADQLLVSWPPTSDDKSPVWHHQT